MRRALAPSVLALVVLSILWSCSKKSDPPPTAPTQGPICNLSATALSFGTLTVGTSVDRSFTLTNAGGGTLGGTVTETSDDFAIIGSATYSLSAGQVATFTVRFSPVSAGAKTCSLATSATTCGPVVASGTGQVGIPVCDVSPTTLDFGAVNYGSSTNRVITVRNTGGGTLTGSISGMTTDYSIVDAPTFSLGPGAVQSFFVEFRPSTGGVQVCSLRVSPAGCAPVACSGFGLLPLSGSCAVRVTSGDTLDFGDVSLGQTAERFVTVRNTSSSYQSSGGGSDVCPDFESNFATNFLPGGSGARSVRFTPAREGIQYCAVAIACGMTGSGTNPGVGDYLICRGVGIGGSPSCQVSASVINFQQVAVGQTKDLTVQVTNTGSGVLAGTAGPSPCTVFSFVGPTSYSLGAGQSAILTVRFTPADVGHTISCPLVPIGTGCATLTLVGEAIAP